MANVEILGIKLQVDTADLPKLQAAAKDAGVAVKDLNAASTELVGTSQQATQAVDDHADTHGRLASALGISRNQLGFLTRELGQASGATNEQMTVVNALTSEIGPLGIAASLAGLAFQHARDQGAEWTKQNTQLIASMQEQKKSIEEITAALVKQGELQGQSYFSPEIMAIGYRKLAEAARDAAIAQAEGAGNAARMADYAQSLKEAEAAANAAGLAHFRLFDGVTAANSATVTFKDDLDYLANAANGAAAQIQRMVDITGDLSAKYGEAGNIRAAGQLDPWEQRLASIRNFVDEQDKADRKREQSNAQAIRDAQANAKIMAQLQLEGAAVSQYAGEKGQQAFDMIANSALSASDKVQLLHRWESQLPEDIRQKIQIYIDTQGLANLMALFGVRGAPGGHQQGNQWDFTFEGEDPATRKAFLDKWGGDTEKAREDWYAQHQKDLEDKGVPKPDDWKNPYNPANSGNQDIARSGTGIGGTRGGTTIVINYTAEGFHTGREEELRANLLPVMERINRELNGR